MKGMILLGSYLLATICVAQTVSPPRPIYQQVPVGIDLPPHDARSRIPGEVFYTLVSRQEIDRKSYGIVATNAADGSQRWNSHDLDANCPSSLSVGGRLKELPSGDVLVTLDMITEGSFASETSCLLLLSGSDGRVKWIYYSPAWNARTRVHAAGVDESGDLLLTGSVGNHARFFRLRALDGTVVWERYVLAPDFEEVQGVEITDGVDGRAVVAILNPAASDAFVLHSFDTTDGAEIWRQTSCPGGIANFNPTYAWQLHLRTDGSLLEFAYCPWQDQPATFFRRLQADGAQAWRRDLDPLTAPAIIDLPTVALDEDRAMARGPLFEGGLLKEFVVVAAESGELMWSRAATSNAIRQFVAGSDEIHLLEGDIQDNGIVGTLNLTTVAADDGQPIRSAVVPLFDGSTRPTNVMLGPSHDGDVLVTTLSSVAPTIYGGNGNLRLVRLQAAGASNWVRDTPVVGDAPFFSRGDNMRAQSVIADSPNNSEVIVAGWTPTIDNDYDYPRVRKIDVSTGIEVWAWTPSVDAKFTASIARNGDGDVFALSDNATAPPYAHPVSRIDGATGATLWTSNVPAFQLFDIALTATRVHLLQRAPQPVGGAMLRVTTLAQEAGAVLWEVDLNLPYAHHSQLEVLADGELAVTAGHSSDFGLTIAKVRSIDGGTIWQTILSTSASSVGGAKISAMANGDAVLAYDRGVWRIDGSSGAILWHQALPFSIRNMRIDLEGQILVAGGGAFAGDSTAKVNRLDAATGMILWNAQFDVGFDTATALNVSQSGDILVAGLGPASMWAAELAVSNGSAHWIARVLAESMEAPSSRIPLGLQRQADFIVPTKSGEVVFGGQWYQTVTWTSFVVSALNGDPIFSSGFEL